MKITETRVYRGPNLYAHFPVIRLTLDLGVMEALPSGRVPGFTDGLLSAVPSLKEHGCSYGEPGGFVRRLTEDEGTWFGHILEHVAIELQQLAGAKVTFVPTGDSVGAHESWLRDVGQLVRAGLDADAALSAMTLHGAELLRVDDRVGSLDEGKHANILFFDGDPFAATTNLEAILLEGDFITGEVDR